MYIGEKMRREETYPTWRDKKEINVPHPMPSAMLEQENVTSGNEKDLHDGGNDLT